MWLLLVALFGLVVPNGLFVAWLVTEFDGIGAMLANRLALAFMLEAMLLLVLLAVHFAQRPPGPIRWTWFVVLSLLGGLGFGLPFYYWLNTRSRPGQESSG
ncbi:MAG TPA: hypothetical protein VFS94_04230 [Gemmatimonadales bacterium]|nr:hypothetical protein [Gemmatimonadales bacterium]